MQNNYVDQTQTGKTSLAGSDVLNTVFANSVLRLPPAQWFTCDIRRQVFLTWLWATFQFNVDKTRVSGAGSGLVGSPGLRQCCVPGGTWHCRWNDVSPAARGHSLHRAGNSTALPELDKVGRYSLQRSCLATNVSSDWTVSNSASGSLLNCNQTEILEYIRFYIRHKVFSSFIHSYLLCLFYLCIIYFQWSAILDLLYFELAVI